MKKSDYYLVPHNACDKLPEKANRYPCHIISTGEFIDKYFSQDVNKFWKQSWNEGNKPEYYDNEDVIWYEKISKDEILEVDSGIRDIRMKYAGTIGLLCDCSVYLSNDCEDYRQSIIDAAEDWCKMSGWKVKRILNRIEVNPPFNEEVKND